MQCEVTKPSMVTLQEGIPLTTPSFYKDITEQQMAHVFRSETSEVNEDTLHWFRFSVVVFCCGFLLWF